MNNPTARSVLKHFKKHSQIFAAQLSATHIRPTKKSVHQLRVTTRRLRAALWLARHGEPRLSLGKLPTDLRYLGQALGKLRELDVAIESADEFHLSTTALKKKRLQARKTLFKKTNSGYQKKIASRIKKALHEIQKHPELSLTPSLVLLRKKILPWKRKTLKTPNDFHRLRIIVKKARYVLEAIGKPTEPLRELQELLGRIHDLEVLQILLGANTRVRAAIKKQQKGALQIAAPTLGYAIAQLTNSEKT